MGLTSKVSRYYYMVGAWTLTDDLKRRFDSFGTSSLRKILGYQWFDFKSNDRLLDETSMINISELIFEYEMAMFGHVARLSSVLMTPPSGFFPVATLRVGNVVEEDRLARGWGRWRGSAGGLELTGSRLGFLSRSRHCLPGIASGRPLWEGGATLLSK